MNVYFYTDGNEITSASFKVDTWYQAPLSNVKHFFGMRHKRYKWPVYCDFSYTHCVRMNYNVMCYAYLDWNPFLCAYIGYIPHFLSIRNDMF